jgi:hypothetical protein
VSEKPTSESIYNYRTILTAPVAGVKDRARLSGATRGQVTRHSGDLGLVVGLVVGQVGGWIAGPCRLDPASLAVVKYF